MFKLFSNLLVEANQKSDSMEIEQGAGKNSAWQTQITQADALWEQGKISEALRLYGIAIEQNPALPEIRLLLAERIKRQGDLAVAYEKIAVGLKNKGEIEQAASYYRQAIQLKVLTGDTKNKLLNKSIAKTNKPLIPVASLKEAAFSFQPLLKKETAVVARSGLSSQVEIESNGLSGTSGQRLKLINPQQAKDIDLETARVYLQKALEHLERQEWQQAALACQQATQIVPNMAKAYKIWGNALQRMGKTSQAMSCYAKAVEVEPNLAEVYAGIADIYVQQQKWELAIKHYQKAIIINPSPKIHRSLADVWRQLGETEKVEFNLERAEELEQPNSPLDNLAESIDIDVIDPSKIKSVEDYCKIAQQLERQNEWRQAAKYYRLALDLNMSQAALPGQDLTQAKLNRTDDRSQLLQSSVFPEQPKSSESQIDKAIKRYHQQAKRQPNSAKVHTDLGNLYARKGKWQYAIAYYRKAIKFDRQYAKAHLNLSRILFKVGKQDEFIKEMQLALSLQPKIGTALDRFYLGNALVAEGKIQQAIAFYCKAIILDPQFVQSYYRIGEILSQQSKHTEAIKFLEQGIKRSPQDPEFYFLLGQQWEALQNWENAVRTYSQVLKLEPQFPEALRKLNYALAQKLKLNHKAKSNSSS